MDVQLYIKKPNSNDYIQLDLFNDEKITLNLVVKDVSDISKIRSDFSQPFTVPCSPSNNAVFQHWYNADLDGSFNGNIRVDAYIEVNSLPFKYGSIQLENCKMKNLLPYCYSITFFSSGVNLSDKFGDDYLKDLDLSAYDHNYSSSVMTSVGDLSLSNGDVYYPLINAHTFMDYGSNANYDLKKNGNTIIYKDFKPALRELRIIEAIEEKYNVTFSRDFFDRSIFYNKFLWLHKDADRLKTSSTPLLIDFTAKTDINTDWSVTTPEINLTNNSVSVDWINNFPPMIPTNKKVVINLSITTTSPNNYIVEVFDNGILYETFNELNGNVNLTIYNKTSNEAEYTNRLFTFKVSSIEGTFTFTPTISYLALKLIGFDLDTYPVYGYPTRKITATSPSQTTANSILKIKDHLPELKVKDYFVSLINQFNLILRPTGANSYYVDTLDNWYNKGNAYDISNLVDIKDVTIKKPNVKKKIDFLYQKTDSVLGKQYFDNNQLSYGDLKATYNISGDDLKIETQFENMLFERLKDVSDGSLTDIQCGFAVDINNNPVKGKAISFYRNGFETVNHVHIDHTMRTPLWHTATEDNIVFGQVTNSLNFGADVSSYFYSPIDTGLYYNFWRTYISELYDKKTRVLALKCKLPIRILQKLGLNDRFIIGDYKYKISSIKVDITNGESDIEIFSDLGSPIDSVDNVIPITVDSTEYTADNDILTVDTVSIHSPVTSYIQNGISLTTYEATKGEENFEVKIDANTNWNIINSNSWVTINKTSGTRSEYIRIKVGYNSGSARSGTVTFNIGSDSFTLTINQN